MIKCVSKYQTSDGELHDSKTAAKEHETIVETQAKLKEILSVSYKTGRAEAILTAIINEPLAVRDVLSSLIRKLGIKSENNIEEAN